MAHSFGADPALVNQARAGLGPLGFDQGESARERLTRVMRAMKETNVPECYFPFRVIAAEAGLGVEQIKPAVRFLANLGYAEFARGLMTDDGEMRGAGYALTEKGHYYIAQGATK